MIVYGLLNHSIRTYSRDSLEFSMVSILSAQVTRSRVTCKNETVTHTLTHAIKSNSPL